MDDANIPVHDEAGAQPADLDALRAEVAAEDTDGTVTVPLGDTAVRVLHPNDWPSSANEDLQAGRFHAWARKALHADDVDTFVDMDPTNRQVEEFFTAWGKVSGNTLGKSAGLNRSQRRMAGR